MGIVCENSAASSPSLLASSCLPPGPLVLAGPTAVGKSEIALLLAQKLRGEIISMDSMQVYRGLDIGTAKPSAEERARVPHHLIDIVDLDETFDAARFVRLAHQAVREIQARGRLPILCGGTGLYFKAFFEGIGTAPAADATLREELETVPLTDLLRELAEADPVTYQKIDRHNPRRVIRAIEVLRLTGKPFSAQRADWHAESVAPMKGLALGLRRPPAELRCRIDLRVEEMFRCGLIQETEGLLKKGLEQNRTAMQALGYRQVVDNLRGVRSLEDTVELIKIRTHQFAKRQMTWFRRQLQLTWIDIQSGEGGALTAERIGGGILAGCSE